MQIITVFPLNGNQWGFKELIHIRHLNQCLAHIVGNFWSCKYVSNITAYLGDESIFFCALTRKYCDSHLIHKHLRTPWIWCFLPALIFKRKLVEVGAKSYLPLLPTPFVVLLKRLACCRCSIVFTLRAMILNLYPKNATFAWPCQPLHSTVEVHIKH